MAGHSKWANIRYRKNAQDARRGKIFTKLIREITMTARTGGGDESTNARLRDAVTRALKVNMKRDTIDNAIKRGLGSADADTMMEMRYEGYGPSGVAVLVDCLSDNRNRTVSDVRHAFTKYSGNLGTDGSVSYLFDARGEIWLPAGVSEESFMDVAIDAGALDVQQEDDHYLILTNREDYHEIVEKLKTANIEIEHSELCMRPQNKVLLNAEASETLIKLIDMLEDLDDVQYVYTNADFPTEEA